MVGVLRLTGEFDRPRREIMDRGRQMLYMGQHLNNPPSVEGWRQGTDWLDTGSLVERINFASEQIGDLDRPGVKTMVDNITAGNGDHLSSSRLVDLCLEQMGDISVSDASREILVSYAEQTDRSPQGVASVLRLLSATEEFQSA